jgi:hypothetical protein
LHTRWYENEINCGIACGRLGLHRWCPPSPSPLFRPSLGSATNPSREMDMYGTVAHTVSPLLVCGLARISLPQRETHSSVACSRRANAFGKPARCSSRSSCSPGQYILSEVAGYPGFRYARPPRLANRTQSHSSDEQHVDSRVRSSLPRGLCGFRSCQPALPGPHTLFGGSGGDKAHHHEGDEASQHSPDYGGVREQPV